MKIRVQRKDGTIEALTLDGRFEVVNGEYMHRFTAISESRLDHYFTHEGFYDGWGGAAHCDEQTANDTIAAMEEKREVEIEMVQPD